MKIHLEKSLTFAAHIPLAFSCFSTHKPTIGCADCSFTGSHAFCLALYQLTNTSNIAGLTPALEHHDCSLFDFVRHKTFKKMAYDVQLVAAKLTFESFSTEAFLQETKFADLSAHFEELLVPPKDVEFKEVIRGNRSTRYITLNTSHAISLFCAFQVVPKSRNVQGHGGVKIDASSNVVTVVPPLKLVHTRICGDFSSQRLVLQLQFAGYSFKCLSSGPSLNRPAKYDTAFPGER